LTDVPAASSIPLMPPTAVHLNGSVNLADAETVMREALARIPQGLRRVPDGETGDRQQWILFQFLKFQELDALVLEQTEVDPSTYTTPKLMLRDGVDATGIDWPDLGYAGAYQESYATFEKLEQEGVVPPGVRFQVEYPTPLASIVGFIVPRDQTTLLPSYEAALFADLDELLAAVPHDRVAVQWDVAVEFGMLEGLMEGGDQDFDAITDHLARCVDRVPAAVPVGLHLCYGDYGHRHFTDPASLEMQIRVIHVVNDKASRPVSWYSVTVPQHVAAPEFFAPLAGLRLPADTEIYFALVPYHPEEQAAGTTEEQVRLVGRHLGAREWGICTECGMGRVERDDVPAMLDAHRELVSRFAPTAGA
jgi:hypothetical protein